MQECLRSYGLEAFDAADYRDFFLQFARRSQMGLQHVCFSGNVAIGFTTVYFTFSTYYAQRVAYLSDLYVTPEFRQRGVGKALLSNVASMAKRRRIKLIQWLVASGNTAAHRFYEPLNTVKSNWIRHSWQV